MGVMRSVLLAGSESPWLRRRAPHLPFIRKAVRRFMPGETLEEAIAAAAALRELGLGTVLTELGENVSNAAQADQVARHYLTALETIGARGLDCHISVKLTQLGLDVDHARCRSNLRALLAHAKEHHTFVWIDMEQHTYVDATLEIYREALSAFSNVGVCLQAYLYRTANDLERAPSARRRRPSRERRVSRAIRCRDAEEARCRRQLSVAGQNDDGA